MPENARPATIGPREHFNLVPFKNILFFLQLGGRSFLVNVIGNLLAFIPLGFCLPALSARLFSWKWVLVIGLVTSVSIESYQFFTGYRISDIDDVILNVCGALLGYLGFSVLHAFLAQMPQQRRANTPNPLKVKD